MKRPSVKKILVKAFAYFSCAAFISTKAQAQTIKVADFTTARATYTAGSSYNLNGTLNVNALAKLTNTTNFGTSGTVAHPLSITQAFGTSGSVTVAGLNSYDILFICYLSAALTTAEQNAIYTWSQQPGKVVICAEQQGFSPYSTLSGYALANGSLNPTLPISTGDNLFHLFSGGVFGTAGSDGILQAGTAQGYFSADCYATVIAQDANHHTGVLFNAKTRDLYFADGGYFTTQTSTGMSSGGSITTSTDKVWANTWAWAINEVLTAPTNPTSVITAQTTVGCTAGSTGALTFISPLGTNTLGEAYTYSIDGTNYQSSPTFSNLAAKTYTIYAKSNSCTVSSGSAVITVNPAATPTVTSVVQPTCTLGTGTVNLSGLPATGNWSIARTGTSTATLTGSGSTTANSGVAPGTYSYTVTNSDGCSSSSSSSAILTLPTGYSSAPNLIANTLSKVLTQPTCADVNGYIQFVDPSSTSTKYMAINPNGNTGYNFTVTALNNNPTIANQKKTDGLLNTTALANRMYTVTDAGTGSYATNGGMVVRIYYASGDSTAARSALDASIATGTYSGKWFKLAGTASNVLSAQTATGITGAVYPAATYGAENGVDYVEFSNITSFSTFGFIEKSGGFALPVGIKTFTVLANNCNADLAWETSTEQNSSSYDIEASTDGANFSKVGEVKSKNIATGASYTYSGYKLTSGVNYFRLKAMDFDGQFSYSQTVSITNGCLANGNVSIFPNPAINVLTIKNILPGSNISLYNSDGKKLIDMIATTSAQNMNIAGFASGVYVLHTLSANGTATNSKVIKQ